MNKYMFELQKAADILIRDCFKIKPGETFVITADTQSNADVVNATAASVFSAGGKPMVIWMASPAGVGKAADPMLPTEALTAVLSHTQGWIEYNEQWLLYSTPFEKAVENNKNLRYMCLVGMTPDLMIRTLGQVNIQELSVFMRLFAEKNKKVQTMRVTTPAGTDVTFKINPVNILACDDGDAGCPGIHMLPGQINIVPLFGSVEGKIVFDGSLTPPIGMLKEPIALTVKNGIIQEITGGLESVEFKKWLESFRDENMFKMAHMAYGFNPGARLTGNVVEDERVWGCTEWGIGYVSPIDAPPDGIPAVSHCDGVCLNSSVWFDGIKIMDEGSIVDGELKEAAGKIWE